MAEGSTEESLGKVLSDLGVAHSKVAIQTYDKELCAQVSFPDYKSLCEAAVAIDNAAKGDAGLRRTKTKTKAQFNEATSIFVRNLPADVGDDELFQEFQKAGSVINCQILRDH